MTNKASLLLAALLVIPAVAIAQTTPSVAPTGAPPAPTAPQGQHMRHHMGWPPSAADMAKLKADMAKLRAEMASQEAAHKATRAKILAALTPAHKAYLANLVGQLAIAANPDPVAATAKLDKILTASERSQILAIHKAAMAQMLSHMKAMMPAMAPAGGGNMRFRRVMVTADGNTGETMTRVDSSAPMAGGTHRMTMFQPNGGPMMKRMHGPMTAGDILMHLAGGANMPMVLSTDMFGGRPMGPMPWRHSHPMIPVTPPVAPLAPVPAVTPAPQATP